MLTQIIAKITKGKLTKAGVVIIIVGVIAFIGLYVRAYGNAQWKQGVEEGFVRAATEIERMKKTEWAEREKNIAVREAEADRRLEDVIYAVNAVNNARAALFKNFDNTLKELENNRVEAYRYAGAVADADLISELRAVSGELAGRSDAAGTADDSWPAP